VFFYLKNWEETGAVLANFSISPDNSGYVDYSDRKMTLLILQGFSERLKRA